MLRLEIIRDSAAFFGCRRIFRGIDAEQGNPVLKEISDFLITAAAGDNAADLRGNDLDPLGFQVFTVDRQTGISVEHEILEQGTQPQFEKRPQVVFVMVVNDQNDPVEGVEHIQDPAVADVNADCRFAAQNAFDFQHGHGLSRSVARHVITFPDIQQGAEKIAVLQIVLENILTDFFRRFFIKRDKLCIFTHKIAFDEFLRTVKYNVVFCFLQTFFFDKTHFLVFLSLDFLRNHALLPSQRGMSCNGCMPVS